ncbi:hypothetical protein [Deinococcus pimensis]|uniref:hypothetical protein n=1 Tax=Deinococcus pimensis TaxID=309888 RepID=UPI000481D34A|nr:hypothetical protein [Deinococcus pimensis]
MHLKLSVIKAVTWVWLLAEQHRDVAALSRLDQLLNRWVEEGDDERFLHAITEELDWLHLTHSTNHEH